MSGNPAFQLRQGLPLHHHTMVYSTQPNPHLPPKSREHGQATAEQTTEAVGPLALSAPKALYHVLPLGRKDKDQKPSLRVNW